jgi:hypothetical protein
MDNHTTPHSTPLTTSQGPLFVRRCGCGGVHLCIGGVSINLGKEAAVFLADEFSKVTEGWREAPKTPENVPVTPLLRLIAHETN